MSQSANLDFLSYTSNCLTSAIRINIRRPHALHTRQLLAIGVAIDGECGADRAPTAGVAEGVEGRGSARFQRREEDYHKQQRQQREAATTETEH